MTKAMPFLAEDEKLLKKYIEIRSEIKQNYEKKKIPVFANKYLKTNMKS